MTEMLVELQGEHENQNDDELIDLMYSNTEEDEEIEPENEEDRAFLNGESDEGQGARFYRTFDLERDEDSNGVKMSQLKKKMKRKR